jgi:putative nucleotidyltransferase with HDIG domain
MSRAVRVYVAIMSVAALALIGALWRLDPHVEASYVNAAICFATLGLLAQALKYQLARGATGSIAFIPFLTIASLAPGWSSVAMIALATCLGEILVRRSPIKALFNVAQYSVSISLGIFAYRAAGGRALVNVSPFVAHDIYALVALFSVFLAGNWSAVSCVVALNERRSPWKVWAENTLGTIVYDLFSLPLLYLFVFVYAQYGAMGALVLALPILGVRQLYKVNWQLEQANQELLQLMVAAIEARDPYTSGHSKRVAHYSRLIARSLGLSNRVVERIGVAALLHDVGKIHEVFAPLLRKPGKLTNDERMLMETHPLKSAELVANVSHLRDAVDSVRHHHENWDGTGYPAGLSGEAIPLGARIIMFADTIDAMTTDRPYRAALGPEEVKSELVRWRGSQFDPHICDVLLSSTFFHKIFDRAPANFTPLRTETVRVGRGVRATA